MIFVYATTNFSEIEEVNLRNAVCRMNELKPPVCYWGHLTAITTGSPDVVCVFPPYLSKERRSKIHILTSYLLSSKIYLYKIYPAHLTAVHCHCKLR